MLVGTNQHSWDVPNLTYDNPGGHSAIRTHSPTREREESILRSRVFLQIKTGSWQQDKLEIPVSGNEQMVTHSGPFPAGSPAAAALAASENGHYVAFYEAAGRVKWSLFSSVRFHLRRRLLRRHRPVSRGFIILLFALIRGKRLSSPAHEGNSRGGGAIYAAALGLRPSQHARSPTRRTCERLVHALYGPTLTRGLWRRHRDAERGGG